MTKAISILGSTGSIGVQTIDIVLRHPDKFKVVALCAGSNVEILAKQIQAINPEIVSVKSEIEVKKLRELVPHYLGDILFGNEGAMACAAYSEAQLVLSAIVGAAGLLPTLQAIQSGKTIGLANKESMVIAGELMSREARVAGINILPVDSEHSAIFQCLQGQVVEDVSRLILTASGGPFLNKPFNTFSSITVEEALKHPNWDMGAKITIDSATMMNKGLEVIEAHWLFNMPVDKIDVVIHPQSIIHSMVEYRDGSVMAQMGLPDMRVPIAYALSYPNRISTGTPSLNLPLKKELTFFEPDLEKFKALKLAFQVAQKGGSYAAVFNAANEVAVEAFLKKQISFLDIVKLVEDILNKHESKTIDTLQDVLFADAWAREEGKKWVGGR